MKRHVFVILDIVDRVLDPPSTQFHKNNKGNMEVSGQLNKDKFNGITFVFGFPLPRAYKDRYDLRGEDLIIP